MNISTSKPAIVVDLDDTLVHVTPIAPVNLDNNNSFTITINRRKFFVQTRPYLQLFLDKLSKSYDIYIFTSSNEKYANKIIDKILPNLKKSCRFFRDSCINMYGYLVKDLDVINKPLSQILLIDDSAGSALKNPKNLVKIKPWSGERNDSVLKNLIFILDSIANDDDLRVSYLQMIKNCNCEGIGAF